MALIVTAEDDDDIREITTRALRRAGHTVVATANGAEGLAAARRHQPDMIITDVDMPRMTGLELVRAVRDDARMCHTPVLVVSGSMDVYDRSAADAGATAVLAKPFTPRDLLSRLDDLLRQPSLPGRRV